MIRALATVYPVSVLCKTLGVSRAGYLAAQRRTPGGGHQGNQLLRAQIRQVYGASRGTYGSPRVTHELKEQGVSCSRKRVARLMRAEGLRGAAPKRYRPCTTDSQHDRPVAPNRLREWPVDRRSNRVAWVGDITYIETREGWLYLAALMDMEVRKIVGWSAQAHMREELVGAALEKALRQRPPAAVILHHTDRGSQYAATGYQGRLKAFGLTPSMSAAGYCYGETTRRWNHSGRRSSGNALATIPLRPAKKPGSWSLSTSRCFTTGNAGIARWGTSARWTMKPN